MLFGLKKLVGVLTGPLTVAMLLLLAAAGLRATRFRRTSAALAAAAVALTYLAAIPPVSDALLGGLERRYPPLPSDPPPVQYVVVLGSGYAPRDGIPITGALDEDGLARVVEGIRLAKHVESARLVLSGGASADAPSPALGYAELARQLGIAEQSIVILDRPRDTAGEAAEIAALLGQERFILVTSAYHMPRAMRLMEQAGARPIPAPTGHKVTPDAQWELRRLLPSAAGLAKSERAVHEFLGLLAVAVGLQ